MNLKVVLPLSAIFLSGCAIKSTPYIATDADYDRYFDNLVIKERKGQMKHPEFGVVDVKDERYVPVRKECRDDAYKGVSIAFGRHVITDPDVLDQMTNDYFVEIFRALKSYKSSSGSYAHAGTMGALAVSSGNTSYSSYGGSNYRAKTIFDDKSVVSKIQKVNDYRSKEVDCVKSKGWEYVSKVKKKKEQESNVTKGSK